MRGDTYKVNGKPYNDYDAAIQASWQLELENHRPFEVEVIKPQELITQSMIGRRVYYRNTIVTVCKPEHNNSPHWVWIDNPAKGYKHGAHPSNLKPLPNGQL